MEISSKRDKFSLTIFARKTVSLLVLLTLALSLGGCPKSGGFTLKSKNQSYELLSLSETERGQRAMTHSAMAQRRLMEGDLYGGLDELEKALKYDPDSAYLNEMMAIILFEINEIDKAKKYAEKAIKLNPDRDYPYNIIGQYYLKKEDLDKAEEAFIEASIRDKSSVDHILNLADVKVQKGQNNSALDVLANFIKENPGSIDALYYFAEILSGMGKTDEAAKIYWNIVDNVPYYYQATADLFNLEIKRGNATGAIKAGYILITHFPQDAESRLKLAGVLLHTGKNDQALIVLEGGKRSGALIPDWWIERGYILLKQKKTAEAKEEFEAALSLEPDSEEAVYALGVLALNEKDYADALSYFKSVPPESEIYLQARRQMAIAALKQGDPQLAVRIVEKIYRKNPDNLNVVMAYSSVCREAGLYDNAEKALKKALKNKPDDESLTYELGATYYLQGNVDLSIQTMQGIVDKNPKSSSALNFIGYTWAEQGINLDEAELKIRKALELEPGAGHIMDSLGWVYYQRGDYETALIWLEKAVKNHGEDPEILEHVAMCHLALGDDKKARNALERALSLATSERIKTKINNRLKEL